MHSSEINQLRFYDGRTNPIDQERLIKFEYRSVIERYYHSRIIDATSVIADMGDFHLDFSNVQQSFEEIPDIDARSVRLFTLWAENEQTKEVVLILRGYFILVPFKFGEEALKEYYFHYKETPCYPMAIISSFRTIYNHVEQLYEVLDRVNEEISSTWRIIRRRVIDSFDKTDLWKRYVLSFDKIIYFSFLCPAIDRELIEALKRKSYRTNGIIQVLASPTLSYTEAFVKSRLEESRKSDRVEKDQKSLQYHDLMRKLQPPIISSDKTEIIYPGTEHLRFYDGRIRPIKQERLLEFDISSVIDRYYQNRNIDAASVIDDIGPFHLDYTNIQRWAEEIPDIDKRSARLFIIWAENKQTEKVEVILRGFFILVPFKFSEETLKEYHTRLDESITWYPMAVISSFRTIYKDIELLSEIVERVKEEIENSWRKTRSNVIDTLDQKTDLYDKYLKSYDKMIFYSFQCPSLDRELIEVLKRKNYRTTGVLQLLASPTTAYDGVMVKDHIEEARKLIKEYK